MRHARLHRRSRRGAAAIEFALTFPLIVVMLLASIEYGNYFSELSVVNAATRDAARYGSAQSTASEAQIQGAFAARTLLSDMGFACGPASPACSVNTNIEQQGGVNALVVRVDASYNQLTNAFPRVNQNLAVTMPTRLRARAVYPIVGP